MATKRIFTRLLSLFLAVATLFSMVVTAGAASIGDGSATCKVALGEYYHYLTTTAGTTLGAGAYQYTTNDGLSGPAYCIDHGLSLTADTLPITGKYNANPCTAGAFANGYPQHTVGIFLGLYLADNPILTGLTEAEFAYATQIAVWSTLGQLAVDGTGFTAGRERLKQPTGDSRQMRVFRAAQLILKVAAGWDRVPQTGMYIRLTDNELGGNIFIPPDMTLDFAADNERYGIKREVIGGKSYYTREYIYASATSTYYNDYTIELWATGAPAGTIFVDPSNKELPRSTWKETATWRLPVTSHYTTVNANGAEYYGKAKLCIPVETATPSGEITLHSAAKIMQYEIYLAYNKKNTQQSYIISDPSKGTQDANAVLTWGSELTEKGKLHITKVGGGGMVLPGATFTLAGTDGSTRTGTTDNKGIIYWEKLDPKVTYTLTETDPPPGYGAIDPITLTVKTAQTSYLTVRDDALHTLVVHKIDRQTGYSLNGAVIRFEQIDGSFTTTKTTDHAGMIQLNADALPIGSYKVYEVAPPEGYDLDTTAQTVHWDGKRDLSMTFRNVRKPTFIISKRDSNTHYSLPDATFEVYKNGQLITTVTTNRNGLAYVSGVTSGYYTVKETIAPQGYVPDSTEHGIHIDLYNPATTDDPRLVVDNAAKPSLRILKYDSHTMKPLPNTTFKLFRDTVLIGTYTTDAGGEILLTALDPGTYLVQEVAAPNSHVVNSTPQQIELKAGQEEIATLVFLNSLKPGIHLVKLDSETMKPLVNATYLISKVGGTFAKEYTTDANGEIDLSALEPGAYTVRETKAPDGYLIDDGRRTIQLNPDENAQFVFTDTPKPGMVVVKYDPQNDKYLPGATFRIAKLEDGSRYLDRVTDTEGRITLAGMEPGIYAVTELAAPSGYIKNGTEYHVALFPGKTSELVVTNQALPNLQIIKTDAITGAPLAGVTFTV
ncbi:MAG: SpaA isopeptide-forming pilin-related protein, partial [Oscillospiraceae bacterium]